MPAGKYNDAKQSGDDITVDVKDGRLVMYGGKALP